MTCSSERAIRSVVWRVRSGHGASASWCGPSRPRSELSAPRSGPPVARSGPLAPRSDSPAPRGPGPHRGAGRPFPGADGSDGFFDKGRTGALLSGGGAAPARQDRQGPGGRPGPWPAFSGLDGWSASAHRAAPNIRLSSPSPESQPSGERVHRRRSFCPRAETPKPLLRMQGRMSIILQLRRVTV
jgi:hypothetical protein